MKHEQPPTSLSEKPATLPPAMVIQIAETFLALAEDADDPRSAATRFTYQQLIQEMRLHAE